MKRQPFEQVIWDWNGTLLDDVSACVAAINPMLRKRGLPRLTRAEYRERFGFPVQDYYRRLGFDFAKDDWAAVAREYHAGYARTSRSAGLRSGARRTLRTLRRMEVPMWILSASELSILRGMLSRLRVLGYFRGVFGLSDLFARSKLDVGRQLLARMAVPPDRALLVGDTTHDWEIAREMRCACVLLAGGHEAERRLRRCPCPLLPRIADILDLF